MRKTFAEGIRELKDLVGDGQLEGEVRVNQVYAHYQDSGFGPRGKPAFAFDHPRGGEAMYLSGPLRYRKDEVLQRWANSLLRGRIVHETIDILHSFGDDVQLHAPRQFEILRNSAALRLADDGIVVFDLPPLIPRLTQEQLNAIRRPPTSRNPSVNMKLRKMRTR